MNPVFLYTDLSGVTVTADSFLAEYPVDNLKDYNSKTRWVSEIATDQKVYYAFPTASTCDTMVIENHNLDAALGVLKLQASSTSDFSSDVTTTYTLSASSGTIYKEFNSTTKQYWRLWFSGSLNTEPFIGNCVIGKRVEIPQPYNWGYKTSNWQHDVSSKITLGGRVRASLSYTGRYTNELAFQYVTDATRVAWILFVKAVRGRLHPFYFVDLDGSVQCVQFQEDYTPAAAMRYGINDIQTIRMLGTQVDESVGTTILFMIPEVELITSVS
jgi:hypothetical protein